MMRLVYFFLGKAVVFGMGNSLSFFISILSPDCLLFLSDPMYGRFFFFWLTLKFSVLEEILILLFKLKQGLPDGAKTG